MRNKMLILRGCPGSGKDTWLKNNGLEQFAISSDNLRLLYQAPRYDIDGKLHIANTYDKEVWQLLFNILETKMKNGQLIIVNACNINSKTINKYLELCNKYLYEPYCVDFEVPLEELLERNSKREEYKQVPEQVIINFYNNKKSTPLNDKIKVFDSNVRAETYLCDEIEDLSKWRYVHIVGDIHGCNSSLQQLFKEGFNDKDYYIFLGDYLDRGIENKETLEFLISNHSRENICFLWGNHENSLLSYVNGEKPNSRDFCEETIEEIKGIDIKNIKHFLRVIKPYKLFSTRIREKEIIFLCSHAGCVNIQDLYKIPADVFVKGIGKYDEIENVYKQFERNTPANVIQVHGHRNIDKLPIKASSRCYNLEGAVEFGGNLRGITITKQKITQNLIPNTIIRYTSNKLESNSVQEFVDKSRRQPKIIVEKPCGDNISSFNFSRKAFYDKVWNDISVKARGMFINTKTNKIIARGYEKFFRVEEREDTQLTAIVNNLSYPVNAYLKYNGFLGIMGYDEENDKIIFCSKSSTSSDFAKLFEDMFLRHFKGRSDTFKEFMKKYSSSLVFEVIDPLNDPHIIEYNEEHLVLLDVIKNELNFERIPLEVAIKELDIREYKEICYIINNKEEMIAFDKMVNSPDYKYKNDYIEGFVLEDVNGFMVKYKTPYYTFWKEVRGAIGKICNETPLEDIKLYTQNIEDESQIKKFLQSYFSKAENRLNPPSLIQMRKLYYKYPKNT